MLCSLRVLRRLRQLCVILFGFPATILQAQTHVASPDGRNQVRVEVREGKLYYSLAHDGRALLLPSLLGFEFRGAPPLRDGLRITDTTRRSHDEWWTQPWGEVARVRDHHNELAVSVEETAAPRRRFTLRVRAFDDGVGFRCEFPRQPGLGDFELLNELTEFSLADNARAWSIPSNVARKDRSEMLYSSSPVSLLDSVQTPLTMETRDGRGFLVIHEANLVDYARMNLSLTGTRGESRTLKADLAPWADGVKVRGRTPFLTPWRTIQLADRVTDLSPSLLGLKLNPPNALTSTDWIHPMKYVGIWWGMHIGTMTWSSGPQHGATTANAKRYIDFAAANGFGGVLVEGWNTGWDGDWIANRDAFSFTQSYPDYDLAAVAAYAKQKGVRLIVHNETSGGIQNYERQRDSAFALYRSLGLDALKTGYVTDLTSEGHSHYSQYMVQHYRRVIEAAAKYGIMLDVHEPMHDTGERRTWPNMMTREGARGQEYNAWSGDGGNPPEHETILFFTRLLAGPMDFTPGIFDILRERTGPARRNDEPRVRTTLAKQLALYVVLYSPLQMAADLPENYARQPAFQFIKDVAVDWDTTRVVDARIGDYVVVARRERGGQSWFVGAITDEAARSVDLPLAFLTRGRRYVAEIYADGPGAHWLSKPLPVSITRRLVTSTSRLHLDLAPGGGQAIRIRPAEQARP
ncbi:MAG TPA: glycoside hydrolase family 97 protein [Gemmatimonadales bacterium]|jgi:alpha-glucosidase|nr:glycoside hydrolase family 97 protein [Gemmatimonadales bacterium]